MVVCLVAVGWAVQEDQYRFQVGQLGKLGQKTTNQWEFGSVFQINQIQLPEMGSYLSAPNTQITCTDESYAFGIVAYTATMQGWRKSLEDRVVVKQITQDILYAAVFDGHGGPEVAEYAARTFHKELKNDAFFVMKDYPRALTNCFKRIDQMLVSKRGEQDIREIQKQLKVPVSPAGKVACMEVGTTAHVVLVTPDKIYSASIGDSRGVVCRGGEAVTLSEDHKPDNLYEKNRIIKAGGQVKNGRINGSLNLSRAFGDFNLKSHPKKPYNEQMVTSIPHITELQRNPQDEYIFIASDGVWQAYKARNQKLIDDLNTYLKINKEDWQSTAQSWFIDNLLAASQESTSGLDNISAILLRLP